MIYVLSIGLNVGDKEAERQLSDTLARTMAVFGAPLAVGMGRSEWNGVPERFVQIAVRADRDMIALRTPGLAAALHQEAIAYIKWGNIFATWSLFSAAGGYYPGGNTEDFPIILDLGGIMKRENSTMSPEAKHAETPLTDAARMRGPSGLPFTPEIVPAHRMRDFEIKVREVLDDLDQWREGDPEERDAYRAIDDARASLAVALARRD